jgi:hypothetical protein
MTDYKITFHDERIFAQLDDAAPEALEAALEWLLKRSQPLVPLDTRPDKDDIVLRETGRVLIDPQRRVGAVVYGDDDTSAYAVRQHEDMTLNHPVPGTQAKFLEEPFEAGKATMHAIMAAHYRRRFR